MAVPVAAHVAAWVVLGGGIAAVVAGQASLSRRLDAIEKAPAPAVAPASAAAGPEARADDPEVSVLRGRVDAAEKRQADQAAEFRKEVERLWAEWMTSSAPASPTLAALAKDPGFDDAVRAAIDRYAMERKFRETIQKASGPVVPKKPAFEQLARALELRPAQAERFAEEIREIQTELYEILSLPRSDGAVLLEEIQQAEQYPEGSPKRTETFLKLFKLTIPDTQETYVERAVALASRVKENARSYFESSQYDTLASLDLDWFGIRLQ